eukprot:SAG31_NODE_888_length_11219_cov_5.584712_4_plen_274_part_00
MAGRLAYRKLHPHGERGHELRTGCGGRTGGAKPSPSRRSRPHGDGSAVRTGQPWLSGVRCGASRGRVSSLTLAEAAAAARAASQVKHSPRDKTARGGQKAAKRKDKDKTANGKHQRKTRKDKKVKDDKEDADLKTSFALINNISIGGKLDCADKDGHWYEATVMAKTGRKRIQVHFSGWDATWDEWITLPSPRVQPWGSQSDWYGSTGKEMAEQDRCDASAAAPASKRLKTGQFKHNSEPAVFGGPGHGIKLNSLVLAQVKGYGWWPVRVKSY